jgi:hypothetical protein
MSFDFGLEPNLMDNATAVSEYINYLNNTFHLVMVSERFEESMVLLKRLMGWGLQDVLYIRSNVLSNDGDKDHQREGVPQQDPLHYMDCGPVPPEVAMMMMEAGMNPREWAELNDPRIATHLHNYRGGGKEDTVPLRTKLDYTAEQKQKHREENAADYALYDYFTELFQRRVDAEGPSFTEEVQTFTSLRQRMEEYCLDQTRARNYDGQMEDFKRQMFHSYRFQHDPLIEHPRRNWRMELEHGYENEAPLVLPPTPFSEQITVRTVDCLLMTLSELPFVDVVRARTYQGQVVHHHRGHY